MTFDPNLFKRQFPLFQQSENTSLVYLDNAATTHKPAVVIDAISAFYTHSNANAHRGSHRLGRAATAVQESARKLTAQWLNASTDEIVFTRGATEALNLLANTLTDALKPGDEIVLSEAEHHANIVPWYMAAKQRGLILRFVPVSRHERGHWQLDINALAEQVNEKTRVVAITAASNVLGEAVDLSQVREVLASFPETNRPLWVVDAAQLAAHSPIDVKQIGCDFLVLAGHKVFGPMGIGILYGKQSCLAALTPWQGGGEMITRVTTETVAYTDGAARFEAGTSSLADIAAWKACVEFWQHLDRNAMAVWENDLLQYAFLQLEQCPWLEPINGSFNNVGIITLANRHPSLSLGDVADWLDHSNIAVRTGHHCAQPLLQRMGEAELLRISLAAYNVYEDIDRLLESLLSMANNVVPDTTAVFDRSVSGDGAEPEIDKVDGFSINDLKNCKHWQIRYKLLLNWGERLTFKPELRNDEYRVQACESGAWLAVDVLDGRLQLAIDSDSRLVKGLAMLLLVLLQNQPVEMLRTTAVEELFVELQFEKYLSASRSNGFYALLKAIRNKA